MRRWLLIGGGCALLVGVDGALTLAPPRIGGTALANSPYWLSFWSGLAYSAWVATVIAVVVSVGVWLLQDSVQRRWAQIRQQEEATSQSIALLNGFYKDLALANDAQLAATATACIPLACQRVFARVDAAPPIVWSQDSPLAGDIGLSVQVFEFMQAYAQLYAAAEQLDQLLSYQIRRINGERGREAWQDSEDKLFFLGDAMGMNVQTVMETAAPVNSSTVNTLAGFTERCRTLHSISQVASGAADYRGHMTNVQRRLERLRKTTRPVPTDYKGFVFTDRPW